MGTPSPCVVLTRSPADNLPLAQRLHALGLRTTELPTAELVPVPVDPHEAQQALSAVHAVAFTSPHGVTAFLDQLGPAVLQGLPLAAVGQQTAQALQRAGLTVRWTATDAQTGQHLAHLLASHLAPASAVVLVCAAHARPELHDGLLARGHRATKLVVYRNATPVPHAVALEAAGAADLVYAAAPSAAERALQWLPELARLPWVAIGPTTASRLAQLVPDIAVTVAHTPQLDDVVAAVVHAAAGCVARTASPTQKGPPHV